MVSTHHDNIAMYSLSQNKRNPVPIRKMEKASSQPSETVSFFPITAIHFKANCGEELHLQETAIYQTN